MIIEQPSIEIEKEDNHPFLIVTKDRFQFLRDRASQEPWKSMKEDALERASAGSKSEPYPLQYYIGAAALAYILDEDNAILLANRVRDAILNQYSLLELEDGSSWNKVVPPMSSFFVAILSLDIVYNDLSIEDIAACEKVIKDQIFKLSRSGNWVDARYGTHGTWDIYTGDRTSPDEAYYNGIMHQITDDGVSPVTNHYAWERVGGGNSRISKSGYMDVLEFTGVDRRYYNNEKLKLFHRWLFGSSVNCSKEMAIFGDMLPNQGISNDMLHRRVVNFDQEAAGYAAWFHEDRPAIGNIISYIIPNQELPAPIIPQSQLYENGGAFFREKPDNPKGLHAVLYNIKSQDEWHTHNEVNGLALSGLGNRLLVNGGRLGEPTRAANLNNTLTVNGANHTSRTGGGIIEGFTADDLDYSSGFSGSALSNASHFRNLILVHGSEEAAPYFLIFDEFEGVPGDMVTTHFHPANQSGIRTIDDGRLYDASIDHEQTVSGTHLSLFYATPSATIEIEKVEGAVQDRYPGYPLHSRISATYATDLSGKINLITALSPFDSNLSKPQTTRITQEGISGGMIEHTDRIKDIFLESQNDKSYAFQNIDFTAKAILTRVAEGETTFYFVRHGTSFLHSEVGFESDIPISIYTRGKKGVITSNGATIKLIGPSIETIQFDMGATILNSGSGFIEVEIPAGEVRFQ